MSMAFKAMCMAFKAIGRVRTYSASVPYSYSTSSTRACQEKGFTLKVISVLESQGAVFVMPNP
jgi:hypothetical protein